MMMTYDTPRISSTLKLQNAHQQLDRLMTASDGGGTIKLDVEAASSGGDAADCLLGSDGAGGSNFLSWREAPQLAKAPPKVTGLLDCCDSVTLFGTSVSTLLLISLCVNYRLPVAS